MRYLFSLLTILLAVFAADAQVKSFKVDDKVYSTGRLTPTKELLARVHAASWAKHGHKIKMMAARAMPDAYDCADFGLVPPVKDQGNCGSCHIFSAFGVATSAHIKAGSVKMSADGYSEQWALDCQRQLGGCDGGWEWDDCQVLLNGGPWESDYGPYRAQGGTCKTFKTLYKISDIGMCSQGEGIANTADIKAMMVQYGPISVAVAADDQFANYRGGDFNGTGSRDINHTVILTGWKTVSGVTYWKMRNSWSASWGLNGYMWIKEKANQIGDSAFWVKAASVNPPDPPLPPQPTGNGTVIVRVPGMPDQTFTFPIPAGGVPAGMELVPAGTKDRIKALIDALKAPTPEPPLLKKSSADREEYMRGQREAERAYQARIFR